MSAKRRVVSLVPSTTESVCALGAADQLVGCTRFCTEPSDQLRGGQRIGGTKNPDLSAILRLEPDLVLANAEENRAEDIERMAACVQTVVQTPRSVVEAANDLRLLAVELDRLEEVEPFLLRIEARIAAAEVATLNRPRRRVYYAVWRKPWMTVSADTFVHDVLALCGAQSVGADEPDRYPAVEPGDAVARGVELVLLASEPWEFDPQQRDEVAASGVFGDAPVVLCDGRDFCWHGTRMADGLGRALDVLRAD